jgi:hypothetical protein
MVTIAVVDVQAKEHLRPHKKSSSKNKK